MEGLIRHEQRRNQAAGQEQKFYLRNLQLLRSLV
jgi:hypothetical protein